MKYTKIKEEYIKDIDSNVELLKHNKSGARILLIKNSDNNKVFTVGFRTPPFDDSGVAHILEHSTLCGSKKFPVKDPFLELIKSSLNTFLNAMTFSDKTIYPCASCNLKDFKNLMEVYMDAVFYPNVYIHPEIFKQEGWHYELNSLDEDISINGIVYNEMKGVFSSPEAILESSIVKSLFPDTIYSNESGGDPDFIPNLSYEKFLEFHKMYYSPANSYIILYGNMDMDERLEWMDKEYLSKFDIIDPHSTINNQPKLDEPKYTSKTYNINEGEDISDKAFYSYSTVIGDYKDVKEIMAFNIINNVLFDSEGAVLKERLLKAGLGKHIYSSFDDEIYQPYLSIISKQAPLDKLDVFIKIIDNTLKEIVENGFEKQALLSTINSLEFKAREREYGSYPKGLIFSRTSLATWLYDENDPFSRLKILDLLDELRKEVDSRYFERLIQERLFNNKHKSYCYLKPTTKKRDNDVKLQKKLSELKQSMSKDELLQLIEDTKNLKIYQSTLSTKEELDTLPKLTKEDLPNEGIKLVNEEQIVDGTKVIKHNLPTNGITYLRLSFYLDKVPLDLLPYASLLIELFKSVNTKKHNYDELNKLIDEYTGGILTSMRSLTKVDKDEIITLFEVLISVFDKNLEKSYELSKEIIMDSLFDDERRIKEVISQALVSLESTIKRSGDTFSVQRALSYINKENNFDEIVGGIEYYNFLNNLLKNFNLKDLQEKLDQVSRYIFNKNNLIISYTSDKDLNIEYIKQFKSSLYNNEYPSIQYIIRNKNIKNEAFCTSSLVNYVGLGAKSYLKNEERGIAIVLNVILNFDYLWNKIRVLGGAYGASSSIRTKSISFSSYRDPSIDLTIEAFKDISNYLKELDINEEKLLKSKISAVGNEVIPYSNKQIGNISYSYYFMGNTQEIIDNRLKSIVNCSIDDLMNLVSKYEKSISEGIICVIGNSERIKNSTFKFDEIKNLNDE